VRRSLCSSMGSDNARSESMPVLPQPQGSTVLVQVDRARRLCNQRLRTAAHRWRNAAALSSFGTTAGRVLE